MAQSVTIIWGCVRNNSLHKQLHQVEVSLEFEIHKLDMYFNINSSVSIPSITFIRGLFYFSQLCYLKTWFELFLCKSIKWSSTVQSREMWDQKCWDTGGAATACVGHCTGLANTDWSLMVGVSCLQLKLQSRKDVAWHQTMTPLKGKYMTVVTVVTLDLAAYTLTICCGRLLRQLEI